MFSIEIIHRQTGDGYFFHIACAFCLVYWCWYKLDMMSYVCVITALYIVKWSSYLPPLKHPQHIYIPCNLTHMWVTLITHNDPEARVYKYTLYLPASSVYMYITAIPHTISQHNHNGDYVNIPVTSSICIGVRIILIYGSFSRHRSDQTLPEIYNGKH